MVYVSHKGSIYQFLQQTFEEEIDELNIQESFEKFKRERRNNKFEKVP